MAPRFQPVVTSTTTSSRARNINSLAVVIRTRVAAGANLAAVSILTLTTINLVANTLAQSPSTLARRQHSTPVAIGVTWVQVSTCNTHYGEGYALVNLI